MTQTALATVIPALKEQYIASLATFADASELIAPIDKELQDRIDAIKAEHQAKHAEIYSLHNDARETVERIEGDLRAAVVDHFDATGEKSFDANLGVQVRTKLVYETSDAVAWAETNAPIFIQKSVDKKAFEKVAENLDFVTTERSVSAVIKGLK